MTSAHCLAAAARRDITPPVGIYHRMWGAATHDRATGVHRPLLATALALAPAAEGARPNRQNARRVVVGIDHCLLWHDDMQRLRAEVCRTAGLQSDELHIAFSHTHATGLMDRSRAQLPGGELIGPYLDELAAKIADAARETLENLADARIVYGAGRCKLAANRDQFDAARGAWVCGYNSVGEADDTVLVARIEKASGESIAAVVNYACHPTTLAWQNTLISPDYVGALREVIEREHGGLCLYLHGASGDLGPREGFTGDTAVADRNGRQLGYAALAALAALPPADMRFEYAGPVVSGATIGTWQYTPISADERAAQAAWRCETFTVDVPYRDGLPTRAATLADRETWLSREGDARASGDAIAARDCRAQIERLDRQSVRVGQLPAGPTFPLGVSLWKIGGGFWVWLEGEYYQYLQRTLRTRLPETPIVVATVVDGWRPAYLPTRETYGRGIYQEQVAVLAPGCLEAVTDSVAEKIAAWL
ncbi:MAG: hypothetical protein DCC68_03000 [Planctomycetota bacterium]|nr:MAG: hypothetical protein DCC68_03000 [Planctomycetota bacterium]